MLTTCLFVVSCSLCDVCCLCWLLLMVVAVTIAVAVAVAVVVVVGVVDAWRHRRGGLF